jgi:cell division protein FtsB
LKDFAADTPNSVLWPEKEISMDLMNNPRIQSLAIRWIGLWLVLLCIGCAALWMQLDRLYDRLSRLEREEKSWQDSQEELSRQHERLNQSLRLMQEEIQKVVEQQEQGPTHIYM